MGSQYYAYLCAVVANNNMNSGPPSITTSNRQGQRVVKVSHHESTKESVTNTAVQTGCFGEQAEVLVTPITPTNEQQQSFVDQGFLLIDSLLPPATVLHLNSRLEAVLAGDYDTGVPPDRMPSKPALGKLKCKSNRTLQLVNVSRADAAFASVVHSPELAALVARLGGKSFSRGARVANDQVWAKPPGAGGLVFHRDSAYFEEMLPRRVLTVWLALDDMRDSSLGPLEYVAQSHTWGDLRRGSANVFFSGGGAAEEQSRRVLVDSAAVAEGLDPASVQVVQAAVPAGGCGIHNGRTWHGSGPNRSETQPRRGLGIHFIPAHAIFDPRIVAARRGKLFRHPSSNGQAEGDKTVAVPDQIALPHWSSIREANMYKARCAAVDAVMSGSHNGILRILLLQPAVCVGLNRSTSRVLAAACHIAHAATLMWDEPISIKNAALTADRRAGA